MKFRIERVCKSTGKKGYYLDSFRPGGWVFAVEPTRTCMALGVNSKEFYYQVVPAPEKLPLSSTLQRSVNIPVSPVT
jgi:hypothetical protein